MNTPAVDTFEFGMTDASVTDPFWLDITVWAAILRSKVRGS